MTVFRLKNPFRNSLLRSVMILFLTYFGGTSLHAQIAPTAVDDEIFTWDNVSASGDLSDNDLNPSSSVLTYSLVTNTTFGDLILQSDGNWIFTPILGLAQVNQTIIYQVCDGIGQCDTGIIAVYIQFHNDVPIPANDYLLVEVDEPRFGDVSINDIEPDSISDPVSVIDDYVIASDPLHGDVIMNLDGTFQYTPDPAYIGSDSFSYVMCDACGACGLATVFLTVVPSNLEPVASNSATLSLNEDTFYNGNAAPLVTDPENDALTFSALNAPMHGTVIMNANGTYTYTPFANYFGTDNFMFLVCDILDQCVVAFINFNVVNVNDAPIAGNEYLTTTEDFPSFSGTVSGNDIDDGGTLTYSIYQLPAHGAITLASVGSFTYSPSLNFNGIDTILIQVCDGAILCDMDTLFINVTPLNDYPIAIADDTFGYEDAILPGTVANDTDAEGDILTYSLLSAASGGVIIMNPSGSFTYTPGPNYWGFETISYQVCDPYNSCATSTLTIEIIEINDDPIINADIVNGDEDMMITGNIRPNDIEPDGESIIYFTTSNAQHGVLVFQANGQFTYTPNANWFGTEVISFYGCDPCSVCALSTLTININSVNDAPVISVFNSSTPEDQILNGNFSSLVSDVDDVSFTFDIVTAASHGTFNLMSNGSFTYQPSLNYFGPDQITYEACDDENNCTQSGVNINVTPVNDVPMAIDDNAASVEDNVLNGSVANDNDNDDVNLFYTVMSQPLQGTVMMGLNGVYTYEPNANFHGTDELTYSVCDDEGACDLGLLSITISAVNDGPVAIDDTNVTYENDFLTASVATNDSDADADVLTYSLIFVAEHGSFNLASNGSYTYSPTSNFSGSDSITYSVCDPSSVCSEATLYITIYATNSAPIASDTNVSGPEDNDISQNLLSLVTDGEGGSMVFTIITNPTNGQLELNEYGSYTYTPNSNYNGTDSFSYQVCDTGTLCDQATANITVTPLNDYPSVVSENISTNEESAVNGSVSVNDSDADGEVLSYVVISNPVSGTFNLSLSGNYTYTPATNFSGIVNIVYNVCDPNNACTQGTIQINVLPFNDGPVATDDQFNTNEDTNLVSNVAINDTDVDNNNLLYSILNSTLNGNLQFMPDGSFTYTPNLNYFGSDSFHYNICDSGNLCDEADVIITINSVNDIPEVTDDFTTIVEDNDTSGYVSENDSDDDGETLTFASSTGALNGTFTLNANGQYNYSPNVDYFGQETILYTACDGQNACAQGVLYILITPVNDLPDAINDEFNILEDIAISGDISVNDFDAENSLLDYSITTTPQNGIFEFASNGQFSYTPFENFFGTEIIDYEVCDDDNGCTSASFTIVVSPVNDPPTANGEYEHVMEDTSGNGDLSSNDSDPDNEALQYSVLTNAAHGEFVLQADGGYTYTPVLNYSGMDSVYYEACDMQNICATAMIHFEVDFMNDAPIAVDESIEVVQDQEYNGSVASNEIELDNELLIYFINEDLSGGNFQLFEDGTYTYLPADGVTGIFTVSYYACDPCAICDEGTLTIYVVGIGEQNTPPTALNTSNDACQNGSIEIQLNDFVNDVQDSDSNLSFSFSTPVHGAMTFDVTTHILSYTADAFDLEEIAISYLVCDNGVVPLCSTGNITLSILPATSPTVSEAIISDATCFDASNGSISITTETSSENYTYQWLDGPDTEDINDVHAGEYVLTITSDNVCSTPFSSSYTIDEPQELVAIVSTSSNISEGNNGSIQLDIQGGSPGYQVEWTGPSDYSSSEPNPSDLVVAGNYAAIITDDHGCTTSASVTITTTEEILSQFSVLILPNPFTESFNMQVQGMNGQKLSYKIYDASGRLIMDKNIGSFGSGNLNVDMKSYPAGVYQLKLISDEHAQTIGLMHE